MERYDYKRALTDDIKDWIVNDTDLIKENNSALYDDDISDWIFDEVWNEDSVTGNGAYWYDTENKCSEYLSNNFDLLYQAVSEYCIDDNINILIKQYENQTLARYFDCIIRCYLLLECIEKALEELKNEMG